MKVLHVITSIDRGGAENQVYELVRGQLNRNLSVYLAFLKGDGYWGSALTTAGADVRALGLKHYGDLQPLMRLRRYIRDVAPDIVHAHMPPAELYAHLALAGLSPAPKLVISKHNDEPFYRGPGGTTAARLVARRSCCIVAISQAVNRYIAAMLGPTKTPVTTIHYGIETAPYENVTAAHREKLRREIGVEPGVMIIGTAARLVPQKALPVMLAGYAHYRQSATRDSRLVLVGRGPLENDLKAEAKVLGIENQVIWMGFREDIPDVMSAFDIFALTSAYEGFGLVLLEAMAARRPIVATAVSAIPEIVVEGETGILCPAGDVTAIGNAFKRLESDTERRRLGDGGYNRAVGLFTLPRMVDAINETYRKCLT